MGRKRRNASGEKDAQYDRFKELDEEWRSAEMGKQSPEIYKDISTIAMNQLQLELAKKMDQDLENLRAQVKAASEPYTEGGKVNKTKLEFLVETLRSRGENVPSIADFLKSAANGDTKDA
jgi:hypothetical protein